MKELLEDEDEELAPVPTQTKEEALKELLQDEDEEDVSDSEKDEEEDQ